ncbi:MAG: hypothetical protein JST92_11305, partial [Deltaproteobacteria bacterium]|nr:hypothetical protein [Deltaproteobacteria bacterium]
MLNPQPQAAGVEERLYSWMTLIAAVAPMISAVPVNLALGITPAQTLALVAFSAVSGVLHWFARKGKRHPIAFSLLLVGVANISWFTDGGADGATTQWIAFVSTLLVLLLSGRTRWVAVGGFILNGFALLWIDYHDPDLIPRMATRADRYIDLASGFPIATIIFGLV